mgnify:CR=1 FL=1
MTNKNNSDYCLPQLFWLDGDSLTKKIADINNCLTWYNSQIKKLDYLGKDHFLCLEYNKQAIALEKVLKALYTIRDNSKILIGE